jgi:hypothetical protein
VCLGEILVGHRVLLGSFNQWLKSHFIYLWSNLGDRTSETLFLPNSGLGFGLIVCYATLGFDDISSKVRSLEIHLVQ